MRSQVCLAVIVLSSVVAIPARAYSPDEKAPDQQSIAALEAKIDQAPQKDQCYLYAELIHQMTEFSVRQYAAGNIDKATDMLKQMQQLAHKVHLSVSLRQQAPQERRDTAPAHSFPPDGDAARDELRRPSPC